MITLTYHQSADNPPVRDAVLATSEGEILGITRVNSELEAKAWAYVTLDTLAEELVPGACERWVTIEFRERDTNELHADCTPSGAGTS